jgi:hypothetical protein
MAWGISFVMFVFTGLSAQQTGGFYAVPDTVPELDVDYIPKVKSRMFAGRPGKAALFSLILPGAGQAYNGKYWQVPIVWAGVGTVGYFMVENSKTYRGYRDAYRERLLSDETGQPPTDPYPGSSAEQIRNERDRWNRFRQLTIIGFAATWIANSAHAFVDAHLTDFDVSEDLSLEIIPFSGSSQLSDPGVVSAGIVLRF